MCAACALLSSGSCKACSCFNAIGPGQERGCILLGSMRRWFMLGVQGVYDWVHYKPVIISDSLRIFWESRLGPVFMWVSQVAWCWVWSTVTELWQKSRWGTTDTKLRCSHHKLQDTGASMLLALPKRQISCSSVLCPHRTKPSICTVFVKLENFTMSYRATTKPPLHLNLSRDPFNFLQLHI